VVHGVQNRGECTQRGQPSVPYAVYCRWKPDPARTPGTQKKRAAYVSTPVDRILKKDRLDSTRITHLHCFHINGTFISPQTQQRTGVDYGR
jgi:hypothetical protein